MRGRVLSIAAATGLVAGALVAILAPSASAQGFGYHSLNKIQKAHVSGMLAEQLGNRAAPRSVAPLARAQSTPQQPGAHGCPNKFGQDVKVNQNCINLTDSDLQGRGQSQNETWIAADPNNPQHVVASYNDYRRGDGTCGVSYSRNGGKTWADTTTPNNFTRGDFVGSPREYWQAGGDTSMAWDTKGNVYLSCQLFNRGSSTSPDPDQSSGFFLYRSTGTGGASFNFPGRPIMQANDTAGAGNVLIDKALMTVDNHTSSPYADRIYVTWTTFAADGTGYIYEAYSSDYGETFSAPVIVSKNNNKLCGNNYGLPTPQGNCNENQDSQPFTASDGTLYVVYNNYNNVVSGSDNRNQVLLSRSTNGGKSFTKPVKVSDFYDLPDCDTYQGSGADPGRACVPEKGSSHNSIFRANNYPIGAADPTNPNRVEVTFGSYINRNSNDSRGCTPTGFASDGQDTYDGVKSGGCNNDILYSVSTDRGKTFSGTTIDPRQLPVVTDKSTQASTDQYWQGAAMTSDGTLVVSYHDRSYGTDEQTGYSDVTVSSSAGGAFTHQRATTSSMPPPTQFAGQFYGDYEGLDVAGNTALPIWSDTRTPDEFACPGSPPAVCTGTASGAPFANDQDTYARSVTLP